METLITGTSVLISLEEHLNLRNDTAGGLRIGAPRLLKIVAHIWARVNLNLDFGG